MKRTSRLAPRLAAVLAAALALLSPMTGRAGAASPPDDRAFAAALKTFEGGWWDLAEQEFAAFIEKNPNSGRRPEAVLRQAQSRYQQKNSGGTVELLSANLAQAGPLADEYQFWLAEAQFQRSNYLAAAEAYGRVVQQFTNSPHAAQAAYNQALACSRLGDWPRVAALLGTGGGVLQKLQQAVPTDALAVESALLLAEARLELKDSRGVEEALHPLAALKLPARSDWSRQYLLCRAQLAEGHPAEALAGATNLVAIAASAGQRELQAAAVGFQAGVLRELGETDAAIAEYEKNLAETVPPQWRHQALLAITELKIGPNRLEEAAQRLEKFLARHAPSSWLKKRLEEAADRLDKYLAQYPQDASSASVLLALGEVKLRRCLMEADPNPSNGALPLVRDTNDLQMALAQFDAVVTNGPQSALYGTAQLDRGWCLWLARRFADSRAAFEAAARALPASEDQAVARFKWADAQFEQSDFRGALTNYVCVVSNYAAFPSVRAQLWERALYQTVRAAIEAGDAAVGEAAMAKIIAWYPDSFVCQSALLLQGQNLTRLGDPAQARKVFAKFEERFPQSPLLPEARLATARTWESEHNWTNALEVYDVWVARFTNNALLPQAQYYRGWASYEVGQGTNALTIFTNLVAQSPTHPLAALAQNWVADYYFRRGDFVLAEDNYQLLFRNKNWAASGLAYQARLMAARAAAARLGFSDALGYLTNLISDANCPADLVPQVYYELGDATALGAGDTNKPAANYFDAIPIFNKLPQLYPTNPLTPLAVGRIGDCYLQLAAQDPNYLTNAIACYRSVVTNPLAGVTVRSQAEVGLALALDKPAVRRVGAGASPDRQLALQHFLNVVYEKNLRAGEAADPFWVKRAGLEAARMAEDSQLWDQALRLYQHLEELLPPLRPMIENRILKAKERLAAAPGEASR